MYPKKTLVQIIHAPVLDTRVVLEPEVTAFSNYQRPDRTLKQEPFRGDPCGNILNI